MDLYGARGGVHVPAPIARLGGGGAAAATSARPSHMWLAPSAVDAVIGASKPAGRCGSGGSSIGARGTARTAASHASRRRRQRQRRGHAKRRHRQRHARDGAGHPRCAAPQLTHAAGRRAVPRLARRDVSW
eukprot:224529-Chlamydomonas_euryale.AAC.1